MLLCTLDRMLICASWTGHTHTKLKTHSLAVIMACFIHVLFKMYEEEGHSRGCGETTQEGRK